MVELLVGTTDGGHALKEGEKQRRLLAFKKEKNNEHSSMLPCRICSQYHGQNPRAVARGIPKQYNKKCGRYSISMFLIAT